MFVNFDIWCLQHSFSLLPMAVVLIADTFLNISGCLWIIYFKKRKDIRSLFKLSDDFQWDSAGVGEMFQWVKCCHETQGPESDPHIGIIQGNFSMHL